MSAPVFLIAAGGTGGHVLPALVVAEEILSRKNPVLFVTDPRGEAYVSKTFRGEVFVLPFTGAADSILSSVKRISSLLKSLIHVRSLFKKNSVQAIIGFGGYPSFPVLLMALLYRIPFMIHEQNAILGRVNRMFGRWATAIATSMSEVSEVKPSLSSKLQLTGIPVRKEIQALRQETYQMPDAENALYITVLGGSQGAEIFSRLVPEALSRLPKALQKRLIVTQQCRPNLLEETQKAYDDRAIKATLAPFFDTMPEILKDSHIVIARAGASTIAELTCAQRPAILIPYPWAKDDHQTANARDITEAGGGWMILESGLTAERLAKKLEALISHPQTLLWASERLRLLSRPKAEKAIVDLLIKEV